MPRCVVVLAAGLLAGCGLVLDLTGPPEDATPASDVAPVDAAPLDAAPVDATPVDAAPPVDATPDAADAAPPADAAPTTCGQIVCRNPLGSTACVGGRCVPSCAPGAQDADGDPTNGCETLRLDGELCGEAMRFGPTVSVVIGDVTVCPFDGDDPSTGAFELEAGQVLVLGRLDLAGRGHRGGGGGGGGAAAPGRRRAAAGRGWGGARRVDHRRHRRGWAPALVRRRRRGAAGAAGGRRR
ncbi:MAG: hypothetical protein H6704_02100 [Myxococcales bacterium]|nr:hypothetical protein [Myxococcales bacterium]